MDLPIKRLECREKLRADRRKLGTMICTMDEILKIFQINVGRCRVAMDLAIATAARSGAGVLIMAEPNKRMARGLGFHMDAGPHKGSLVVTVTSRGSGRKQG